MTQAHELQDMNEAQLREFVAQLLGTVQQKSVQIEHKAAEIKHNSALIDKLTFENAMLKRLKFAAKSEALNADQRDLLNEALDADLEAVSTEIEQLLPRDHRVAPAQPKRLALPAQLPREEFRHEPEVTECCGQAMKRMGEDVSEKLDYQPGVFTVHRHVRGKWVCACCQSLKQKPVDAHIIDKGIPTTGLLAHVMVAKYADHQPLYRQETTYARAGVPIPRSTLSQWIGSGGVQLQPVVAALREEILTYPVLHADETPVQMLKPASARDGKTHRAYLWAYATGRHEDIKAVVYDFCETRAGRHAAAFLQDWSGYKQLMGGRIQEAACWAHARRKFFELHTANQSQLAQEALRKIALLYEIERQASHAGVEERRRMRQERSQAVLDELYEWLVRHRVKVPDGSETAKAMDYTLRRWTALCRYAQDGRTPIDNNWVENQIRPVALGRKNWLFAGSLRAGQRAAVMSLIQSAKLNGHDPHEDGRFIDGVPF